MKNLTDKVLVLTGIFIVIISIILGAFGAHGLKDITNDQNIWDIYDKAVKYQLYHGFGILILAFLSVRFNIHWSIIYYMMLLGVLLFSGSLYIICYLKIQQMEIPKIVGVSTPIGGVFFIVGWSILFWKIYKSKN